MATRRTTRFAVFLGIISLLVGGLWQLNSILGGGNALGRNAGGQYGSADAWQREVIPREGGDETGEPKDETQNLADALETETLNNTPEPKRPKEPDREPQAKQGPPMQPSADKKKVRSIYRWLVVSEFGQPTPEVEFQLSVEENGKLLVWELESSTGGRLNLPESELSDESIFRRLQVEDNNLSVHLMGHVINEPLRRELVIRVSKKGALHVRLTDRNGAVSKLNYLALLFSDPHELFYSHSDQLSRNSTAGEVSMRCAPGVYHLVVAPENATHHVVTDTRSIPIQVKIQPGKDTYIQLPAPNWDTWGWNIPNRESSAPLTLELMGSGTLLTSTDSHRPRWKRTRYPDPETEDLPMRLEPINAFAHVHQGGQGASLAILQRGSVIIYQGPNRLRKIHLDALVGDGITTTIRPYFSKRVDWDHADGRVPILSDPTTRRSPDWYEVHADYANDSSWKHAEALIGLVADSKPFNVDDHIKPANLDLNNPPMGRTKPPIEPGLRWTSPYPFANSGIMRLAVDLRPSGSLHLSIPVLRESASDYEGTLGWTPLNKPGVLGIGEWTVTSTSGPKPTPPGFRTFSLKCIQASNQPAPYAMVQVRDYSAGVTWQGSADKKGRIQLQVMGPGPFWIDSALVSRPVQLHLNENSLTKQVLVLVVPMRHNQIQVDVAGQGNLDHLKVRVSRWFSPKDNPERLYPPIAEEYLSADGTIVIQSLIQADYQVEIFDPTAPDNTVSRRVKVTHGGRNPIAKFLW